MSVEDRVRNELEGLSPAEPSGAYERIVEKRIHRHLIHRVEAGFLTVAVLAGSLLGFSALTHLFGKKAVTLGALGSNGRIAFVGSYQRSNGSWSDWQLFTMESDGRDIREIQLPDIGEVLYPTWSPDGSQIAFVGFTCRPLRLQATRTGDGRSGR